MANFEYTVLSVHDRLNLARDLLRAKESDHYRFTLVNAPGADIEKLEEDITALKKNVAKLEKEAK